jgi:hypothetical protein
MASIEELQRARRVIGSVRHLLFDDMKYVDVTDRFGLLTVAAGARDVAAFGFASRNNAAQMSRLKETLDRHSFQSLITDQVVPISFKYSADVAGDLVEVFDRVLAESHSRDTGRLLWVFRDTNRVDEIEKAVAGECPTGILLGYPPCCVQRESIFHLRNQHAFAAAIIGAVGKEANAVERALLDNLQVEILAESADDPNILNTRERFPFVFHTACEECLSSDQSRTAELNSSYGELAMKVDRALRRLFLEIAKLEVAAGRIFEEAEKNGLRPQELDQRANQRLREIARESDRLYARIFKPREARNSKPES